MQNPIAQAQRKARQRLVKLLDTHKDAAKRGGNDASVEWERSSDVARVLARLDPAIQTMGAVEDEMYALRAEVVEEINAAFANVTKGKKATPKKRRGGPGKKRARRTKKAATKKTGRKGVRRKATRKAGGKAKKTGRTKGGGAAKQTTAKAEDPARVAIEAVLRKHGKDTPPADVVRLVKEEHGHDVTPMKVGAVRRNFKE